MKIDWQRLFTPTAWFQIYQTDRLWDKELNDILDNIQSIEFTNYTTTINGITLWTSNWPYAYGFAFDGHAFSKTPALPTMKTRRKLRRLVSLYSNKSPEKI